MKKFIPRFLPVADILLATFVYSAAWLLKNVRRAGVPHLTNGNKGHPNKSATRSKLQVQACLHRTL
jgi:hypothetical protein